MKALTQSVNYVYHYSIGKPNLLMETQVTQQSTGLQANSSDEAIRVGPGQVLCIPCGSVHRFDNPTSHDAKALCVITPSMLGPQYCRQVAAAFNAAVGGRGDKAEMMEIVRRHGLTPAPPPPQA
jgi:hypothetical protein